MVTVSYLAMYFGIVPKPNGTLVVWSTPVFLSGWLGTGSIRGGLLQIVNMIIAVMIWFPFLKVLDKGYLKDEQEEVVEEVKNQSVNL